MRRDQASDLKFVESIAPAGARATSTNGSVVDTQGYESVTAFLHMGTRTDGSYTAKLQEGDAANGSDQADVAAADLVQNGFAATTSSNVIQECGYIGRKRYIRVVVTQTGATTGAAYAADVCLGRASQGPA